MNGPISVTAALWKGFLATYGPVTTLLGIAATLFVWVWDPDKPVPIWTLVVLSLGFIVQLFASLAALRIALEALSDVPIVTKVRKPSPPFEDSALILLVHHNRNLAQGNSVTIALCEDDPEGYERPIGVGIVRDQQQNGKILVTLERAFDSAEDLDAICKDDRKWKNLVLRPMTNLVSSQPNGETEPPSESDIRIILSNIRTLRGPASGAGNPESGQ